MASPIEVRKVSCGSFRYVAKSERKVVGGFVAAALHQNDRVRVKVVRHVELIITNPEFLPPNSKPVKRKVYAKPTVPIAEPIHNFFHANVPFLYRF